MLTNLASGLEPCWRSHGIHPALLISLLLSFPPSQVWFRADRLGNLKLIDYFEKKYAQGFCVPGEEWPVGVWNTVWDMARMGLLPPHIQIMLLSVFLVLLS